MICRKVLVAVGVVALALCVPLTGVANAHAAYRASDPPDESTVSAPPSQVWAEFTEPVVADSRLEVYDPCGTQVDDRNSTVTGYRITIGMSGSARGTYTVRFEVVSAVDGHPTNGAFTFTSTGGDDCAGAVEQPSEPEEADEEREGRRQPSRRDSGPTAPGDDPTDSGGSGVARDRSVDGGEDRGRDRARDGTRRAPRSRAGADDPDEVAAAPGAEPAAQTIADLPLDGLIVGLLVSAAIGAAGGAIYAGIMGPRD